MICVRVLGCSFTMAASLITAKDEYLVFSNFMIGHLGASVSCRIV